MSCVLLQTFLNLVLFALKKTWLNDYILDSAIAISDYVFFRKDRDNVEVHISLLVSHVYA